MATINELEYYCREENSFGALMFTGKWGCGKTYLIENDLTKILGEDYIIIRVSLFGESSIDSIHQKVQKAYFQEVMLNMGDSVEEIVKSIPKVSDEKAANIGNKVEEATEALRTASERISKSKFGKVIQFASGLVTKLPGVDKILSLDPSDCIPVEDSIAGKKIILVFDDLERSSAELDEVDILGCINEYCENKHIKTIIVANEDKIIARNSVGNNEDESLEQSEAQQCNSIKIKYSEIKEKIVIRTIKNSPNYKGIIEQVVNDYQTQNKEYKVFLQGHVTDLFNVFNCGKIENIRSVKCAIQDFQRVYVELIKQGINEGLEIYFQTFIAYTFLLREGKISKSDRYGYLFCDYDVEKVFPGFYVRRYMLTGVREWLMEGEWNEGNIQEDIEQIIELGKEVEPKELIRNMRLIDLEEDTIKEGFSDVLQLAYAGELAIDEYITLIGNLLWARTISYQLPETPDMEKVNKGVDICLTSLCESDTEDTRIRKMISPNDIESLTLEEKDIYKKICDFRDKNVQMFTINRRKYLRALQSRKMSQVYDCENKRFNIFDEGLAVAVLECYKELPNADRTPFIGAFKKMWGAVGASQDLLVQESIPGFEKLKEELRENKVNEQEKGNELKAAFTENFTQELSAILRNARKVSENAEKETEQ